MRIAIAFILLLAGTGPAQTETADVGDRVNSSAAEARAHTSASNEASEKSDQTADKKPEASRFSIFDFRRYRTKKPSSSVNVATPPAADRKTPLDNGQQAGEKTSPDSVESLKTNVIETKSAPDFEEVKEAIVSGDVKESTELAQTQDQSDDVFSAELDSFCQRVDEKLTSISHSECVGIGLVDSGADSNNDTPLLYRDFFPAGREPVARVLLVGGIHGDEYSSVSIVFKWLGILNEELGENFHWRVIPVLNPDGLLQPPRLSQRVNANGVDLNRNFPTPDWNEKAHAYWVDRARKNKRRYPGPTALSEPESAWLAGQIETFKPHAVISVHAPHGVIDFDGPRVPPTQLGPLELKLLGTYPGSMGRYIGIHKGIPLLTVELESAFGMPETEALFDIWYDMLGWLHEKIAQPMKLAIENDARPPAAELLRVRDQDNDG